MWLNTVRGNRCLPVIGLIAVFGVPCVFYLLPSPELETVPVVAEPRIASNETKRREHWQAVLERDTFSFSDPAPSVMPFLSDYWDDCTFHIRWDRFSLALAVERGGKEILRLVGHRSSPFRTDGRSLYFAEFCPISTGCAVAAYDLRTGTQLWKTKLSAVGDPAHLRYSNRVAMSISRASDLEPAEEGVIAIAGRETAGDYVEILDRRTGTVLARKVYRLAGEGVAPQQSVPELR